MIKDNSIFNLKDKGISVGENTIAIINNNNFKNNNIAIAIKDESKIYSFENIFSNNKLRFSMYIKKFFYGSPALFLNKDEYNNFNLKELNELFDIKDGLLNYIENSNEKKFYKKFLNDFEKTRV